jgi:hypothetical protein
MLTHVGLALYFSIFFTTLLGHMDLSIFPSLQYFLWAIDCSKIKGTGPHVFAVPFLQTHNANVDTNTGTNVTMNSPAR